MNVYELLKQYLDGLLGIEWAATSKYLAGGLSVFLAIGLIWLMYRCIRAMLRV